MKEFGELAVAVRTAGISLRHAADLVDVAHSTRTESDVLEARLAIADARLNCGAAATKVADQFFLLTGARATLEKSASTAWRNAATHSLHDPSVEALPSRQLSPERVVPARAATSEVRPCRHALPSSTSHHYLPAGSRSPISQVPRKNRARWEAIARPFDRQSAA